MIGEDGEILLWITGKMHDVFFRDVAEDHKQDRVACGMFCLLVVGRSPASVRECGGGLRMEAGQET